MISKLCGVDTLRLDLEFGIRTIPNSPDSRVVNDTRSDNFESVARRHIDRRSIDLNCNTRIRSRLVFQRANASKLKLKSVRVERINLKHVSKFNGKIPADSVDIQRAIRIKLKRKDTRSELQSASGLSSDLDSCAGRVDTTVCIHLNCEVVASVDNDSCRIHANSELGTATTAKGANSSERRTLDLVLVHRVRSHV